MIYFVCNDQETKVKIGFTNDPLERISKLEEDTLGEFNRIICVSTGNRELERALHREWASLRLDGSEETFELTPELRAFANANDIRSLTDECEKLKSRIMIISPVVAKSWLDWFRYDKQRRLRKDHIDELTNAMTIGRFQPTAQIGLGILDDLTFLVNGYHTLHAILRYNRPVVLNVVEHEVDSLRDLGLLYSAYDAHIRRTIAEIAAGTGAPENCGLTERDFNKVSYAVKFMYGDFLEPKAVPRKNFDIIDCLDATGLYADCFRDYIGIIAGSQSQIRDKLLTKAVLAPGLLTLKYFAERQVVQDFWFQVARDDGLRSADPRKHLNFVLRSTSMAGGGAPGGSQSIRPEQMSRYVAHCWNHWAENRRFTELPTDKLSRSAPVVLVGTPFDGRVGPVLPWPESNP